MFKSLVRKMVNAAYGVDIEKVLKPETPQLYYYTQKGYQPRRSTDGALCFDVTPFLPNGPIMIYPNETALIGTGLYFEFPEDYDMFVRDRSGNSINKRIVVANRVGIVDNDYRGELMVALKNESNEPFEVIDTYKMAQVEIRKRTPEVEWVEVYSREELNTTLRGAGRLGSTDNTPK